LKKKGIIILDIDFFFEKKGAFKFGGYEFWKKTLIESIGIERASEYRTAIYLTASAFAEFFADIALWYLFIFFVHSFIHSFILHLFY
jgi:hypothetical protein